jgi:hypothetical protein
LSPPAEKKPEQTQDYQKKNDAKQQLIVPVMVMKVHRRHSDKLKVGQRISAPDRSDFVFVRSHSKDEAAASGRDAGLRTFAVFDDAQSHGQTQL